MLDACDVLCLHNKTRILKISKSSKKDSHTVWLSYPVKILLVAMALRRLHIRTLLVTPMRIAAKTNRRCIEQIFIILFCCKFHRLQKNESCNFLDWQVVHRIFRILFTQKYMQYLSNILQHLEIRDYVYTKNPQGHIHSQKLCTNRIK